MTKLCLFDNASTRDKAFWEKLDELRANPECKALHSQVPKRKLIVRMSSGKEQIFIFQHISLSFDLSGISGILADEVEAQGILGMIDALTREVKLVVIRSQAYKERAMEDFTL